MLYLASYHHYDDDAMTWDDNDNGHVAISQEGKYLGPNDATRRLGLGACFFYMLLEFLLTDIST